MKSRNFSKSILLILYLFLATNLFGQEQQYSLNQLLDRALQNNYLLKSTEKNKLVKQSELEVLQTNYLPTVSASASFSYWKFLLPNKERLLGGTLTDMFTDISAYQTLYDFGQTKLEKSMVDQEILLNDEMVREIKQTIILGVTNAYFETLTALSEIKIYESALQQLNEQLNYSENLYKIGKTSAVDILKIKVEIAVQEKKLQQSRNLLISKRITLKQLSFIETTNQLSVVNQTAQWFSDFQNDNAMTLFSFDDIYKNHPSLKNYDIKIDIQSKQNELLKAQTRPELFSYGIASWNDGYIPFYNNFNYNIGLGIRYTLPFWGNSGYKSKIIQSEILDEQFSDQKSQTFLEIKKEIDISLNTLNDIKNTIASNKEIMEMAKETIKNATILYQAGQGNIIDILDAQQILTEASIEYDKSTIDYLQTLAELNYLTGNDTYPF